MEIQNFSFRIFPLLDSPAFFASKPIENLQKRSWNNIPLSTNPIKWSNTVASRDDVRVFLINFVQVLLTQSEAHCLEEMARRCFVKMVLL